MLYRETKPSVQSEHFVQGFWTLEDDSITGKPQRVVPDGHPELILNLGEPFEVFERGEWHRQPRCFLAGQITGPLFLRANGPAKIRGIRFRPYGAAQVWGTPMDELTGRFTPLADLNATLAAKLDQALESGGSTQLIEGVLATAVDSSKPDPLAAEAVRRIKLARGAGKLRELAGDLGLSVRQLERRFRTAVGLSPKLFCRVQRFANVFQVMGRGSTRWVEAALAGGYYDQAHLIRDFKDFSGETPVALLVPDYDLARHFLTQFGMSHSYNTAHARVR